MQGKYMEICGKRYDELACVTSNEEPGTLCQTSTGRTCKKLRPCEAIDINKLQQYFSEDEIANWPAIDVRYNYNYMVYSSIENDGIHPDDPCFVIE